MDLENLKRHWDALGRKDPLWAILIDPAKRNGGWNADEFFRTGEKDVEIILRHVGALNFPLKRAAALDFGCGVGRLTQALCRHFEYCCGVDIAPSMIRHAIEHNRYGKRCHYVAHDRNDLSLFGDNTFDFICSLITLQHMRPEYSERYFGEFLRILKPGGLLVVQMPSEAASAGERKPLPEQNSGPNIRALPESAFKAHITVREPRVVIEAGTQYSIRATVRNDGDVTWPSLSTRDGRYRIHLANHWLDENGRLILNDDGRKQLPADLHPGEEVALDLTVSSPSRPGQYILELDLVQEMVTWFKEKGSVTTKIPARVTERASRKVLNLFRRVIRGKSSEEEPIFFIPVIEMHALKKDVVLKLVEDHGGKIVDVERDFCAGDEWVGFRYYITK